TVHDHQDLVARLRRRVDAGEDARRDLARAELDAIAASQRLAVTRRQAGILRVRAAAALGVPPAALDGIDVDWSDLDAPAPTDSASVAAWRSQALLSRSDVRHAVAGYAASEQSLRLEVAKQYPSVRLSPAYVWERGVTKLPFNIGLTLPVAGRNK